MYMNIRPPKNPITIPTSNIVVFLFRARSPTVTRIALEKNYPRPLSTRTGTNPGNYEGGTLPEH